MKCTNLCACCGKCNSHAPLENRTEYQQTNTSTESMGAEASDDAASVSPHDVLSSNNVRENSCRCKKGCIKNVVVKKLE